MLHREDVGIEIGYKLANDGHDTRAIQAHLWHRNIQNTTRYTAVRHSVQGV
jgi:site-specific recombinase XerD